MHARRVNLKLKPNTAVELPQMFDSEIIPALRKQKGFVDEMLFINMDKTYAFGISLWEDKESAEVYHAETYPTLVKSLAKFVDGTPQVHTYEVANSTCHKIAVAVAV